MELEIPDQTIRVACVASSINLTGLFRERHCQKVTCLAVHGIEMEESHTGSWNKENTLCSSPELFGKGEACFIPQKSRQTDDGSSKSFFPFRLQLAGHRMHTYDSQTQRHARIRFGYNDIVLGGPPFQSHSFLHTTTDVGGTQSAKVTRSCT